MSPHARKSDLRGNGRGLSPYAKRLIESAKKKKNMMEKTTTISRRRRASLALESKLGKGRPSLRKLKQNNLIHTDHKTHHAPAIAKKMKKLQRKFKEDALHAKIREVRFVAGSPTSTTHTHMIINTASQPCRTS